MLVTMIRILLLELFVVFVHICMLTAESNDQEAAPRMVLSRARGRHIR